VQRKTEKRKGIARNNENVAKKTASKQVKNCTISNVAAVMPLIECNVRFSDKFAKDAVY